MYVGLVGLRFLSGEATKFVKDLRSDADGDQMFGVAGDRTTNAAGATGAVRRWLQEYRKGPDGDPAKAYAN